MFWKLCESAVITLKDKSVIRTKQEPPSRIHHLDWLRVFATMLLIPFHCLEPFGLNVYYINAANRAYPYEVATNLIHLWHMPLLFFISGYASAVALKSNSTGRYFVSRLKRLAVPLVFGMLTLVPLVGYLSERTKNGIGTASFFDYYPAFFRFHRGDIGGFTGGLSTHHLWFLVYLLAFSLIGLALSRWLETRSGARSMARCSHLLCRWPGLVFLAVIPLAAARASTAFYPSPLYFALFFAIGFLVSRERRLEEALKSIFLVALVVVVVATPVVLAAFTRQSFESGLVLTFFVFEDGFSRIAVEFVALSWLVVIWWLAARFLTRKNRVLDYLNTGSIAVYLLHFAVVMAILRLMTEVTMSSHLAFLLASCGALIATVAVYEIAVRPFRWVRFLLGIAPHHAKPL